MNWAGLHGLGGGVNGFLLMGWERDGCFARFEMTAILALGFYCFLRIS